MNSNITSLTRTGKTMSTGYPPDEFGTIDDLSLSYTGNRLQKVTDSADEVLFEASLDFHDGADNDEEYGYDANGNMVRDDNRGIVHIDYNVLNLPQTIAFSSGDRLDYTYDAAGVKLAVEYTPASVDRYSTTALPLSSIGDDEATPAGLLSIGTAAHRRDYFAGCEWENGVFTRMNTPYGYHDGTAYYARIPDYQGNVIAVVKAGTDIAAQSNYYYPYGLPTAMSSHPEVNRYKYGGKELETRHGLNLYDFEARWHDPQTARFLQPDPMADDYPWLSPYAYCAGNPIRNIDPTGMRIEFDIADYNRRKELEYNISELQSKSNLFSLVYNILDQSTTTYTITFGETVLDKYGDRVPGEFEPGTNTIKYNEEIYMPSSAAMVEEIYHAYQEDQQHLNNGEWNREFEAKIITTGILGEGKRIRVNLFGLDKFFDEIYLEPGIIKKESFLDGYITNGNLFVMEHQNIANYNYPVSIIPNTLLNIITLWRPKLID